MNINPLKILMIVLSFYSLDIYAQSSSYVTLFRVYEYKTDNNEVNLDTEFKNDNSDFVATNIFFKYYKNSFYSQQGYKPEKLMMFRLCFENIFQTKIDSTHQVQFEFPFKRKKEKLLSTKIINTKIISKKSTAIKLRNKQYDISYTDSTMRISIDRTAIELDDVIRVYWEIESANFNSIAVKLSEDVSTYNKFISLNIPSAFVYDLDNRNLSLVDTENSQMLLKKFSNNGVFLIDDLRIDNTTYKWTINDGSDVSIIFPLISINLPPGVGTSSEEILKVENE